MVRKRDVDAPAPATHVPNSTGGGTRKPRCPLPPLCMEGYNDALAGSRIAGALRVGEKIDHVDAMTSRADTDSPRGSTRTPRGAFQPH